MKDIPGDLDLNWTSSLTTREVKLNTIK
jgi:hypothetical protein